MWLNIAWISFRATGMLLWKPWINKLVTFCSHDHFQFEFHPFRKFLFSGEACLQKKSKDWFQSVFKSLNVIVSCYTTRCSERIFPRFSLDVAGNTPTFQCKAAVSSLRKLLWVHSKFENEFNKCGKWQTVAKYIENIPDTLCIQLSASGIKRIGFVRFTDNCQQIMSIS